MIEKLAFDIASFYEESLNRPLIQVFGYFFVITFFLIIGHICLWNPVRRLFKKFTGEGNRVVTIKNKSRIKQKFVDAIEPHYLKEKIKILRRQKEFSEIPEQY
mmetsp:Transcript_32768/g.29645  ORF Transcript_32768/g.29645 Transcript_32768/m.29645 type:complete len:103 (+) Transcript_32768:2822-3130(+)